MSLLRSKPLSYTNSVDFTSFPQFRFSQLFDNGHTIKRDCPQFDGTGGMEALLHVEEEFMEIARDLRFSDSGTEMYAEFQHVLLGTAKDSWKLVLTNRPPRPNTMNHFKASVQELYLHYCSSDARNVAYEYLKSPECLRKLSTAPREHVNRMKVLIRCAAKLPGTEPIWTDEQEKTCIFNSFTTRFKTQYYTAGRKPTDDSITGIIEFMETMCSLADQQDRRDKRSHKGWKKNDPPSKKARKDDKNSPKDNEQKKAKLLEPCRKHQGAHPWGECPDYRGNNRKDEKSKQDTRGREHEHDGGRGRGRGRHNGRGGYRRDSYGRGYRDEGYYQQTWPTGIPPGLPPPPPPRDGYYYGGPPREGYFYNGPSWGSGNNDYFHQDRNARTGY